MLKTEAKISIILARFARNINEIFCKIFKHCGAIFKIPLFVLVL